MTLPWGGVPLAPRHWPGQEKVLTLAATLRLVYGEEVEVSLHPPELKGKRTVVKYTSLPLYKQVDTYWLFRDYYNRIVQRTLE